MRAQRDFPRIAILSVLMLLLMLSTASAARAQLNPNYGRPSPVERDMRYRDWVLDQLRRQKKISEKDLKLAFDQIQHDYQRMQVINNDFLREAAKTDDEIDYKLIVKETDELQKCAARLKTNLFLPEGSGGKHSSTAYDDLRLKTLLSLTDTLVMSFIKNPMFKSTEVIDVKLAEGARRDLDAIIRFGDRVRKKAEQLKDAKK